MFEIIIKNGTIADGTGKPCYKADIGINNEKITAIKDLSNAKANHTINASGLTVSPGFIDTHAHSDGILLLDPQHANGIRQGITTEILGQDGLSYAPLSSKNYLLYRKYLAGLLGEPPENLDMSNISTFRSHYHKKVAINTAYNVPHGAIRLEILGFHDRPLIGKFLEKAKRLIFEAIQAGAVGFSTGMSYYPNAWSNTAELIELCKTTKEAGGGYVTHLRDVNTDRGFGGGGVPEALEIGRRSGVKVHFSHYRTYVHEAGQVKEKMSLIDKAKTEGVDVTLELYPYPTASSFPLRFLPSNWHEGGPDLILKKLKTPKEYASLIQYLETKEESFSDAVFTYLPQNQHLEGMSIRDIAKKENQSMSKILCNLLIDENLQVGYRGATTDSVKLWQQVSRDCVELLSRPDYMVGSDAIPLGTIPHPRAYGTFPRFLGRLRRSYGNLSLEEMVQRMTDNPARRFGLTKRGQIKKDYFADLVIFNPDTLNDTATYDDPCQFPTGIPFVLVNGQIAVNNEKCTGILAGQAIP